MAICYIDIVVNSTDTHTCTQERGEKNGIFSVEEKARKCEKKNYTKKKYKRVNTGNLLSIRIS